MRRALRRSAIRIAFLMFVASAALPSCSKARHNVCGEGVDEALLAWLSTARALHHEADLAEEERQDRKAVVALERLLTAPTPRPAPEIAEVLADTRARLADLRSRGGDYEAALADVEAGLANVPGPSYFRGHLLEVRGLVQERRAKRLVDTQDVTGAEAARELAKKSYEEAVLVQEQVIARTLRNRDGGTR